MSAHAVQHGLEHWNEALKCHYQHDTNTCSCSTYMTPVVLLLTNKSFIPMSLFTSDNTAGGGGHAQYSLNPRVRQPA